MESMTMTMARIGRSLPIERANEVGIRLRRGSTDLSCTISPLCPIRSYHRPQSASMNDDLGKGFALVQGQSGPSQGKSSSMRVPFNEQRRRQTSCSEHSIILLSAFLIHSPTSVSRYTLIKLNIIYVILYVVIRSFSWLIMSYG